LVTFEVTEQEFRELVGALSQGYYNNTTRKEWTSLRDKLLERAKGKEANT
jgi:hypothetical protein